MATSDEIRLDVDKVEEAGARSHALAFPPNAVSGVLERLVERVGKACSWIWVILIVLIVVNVALRYVVGTNFIAMEELQWHLYAIGFLMALSFAVLVDGHVRVDVIAEHMPLRRRAWIELFGLLFLLLPFVVVVTYNAVPFVERAYQIGEVSAAPGGLPMRWIIKSFMITGFVFVAIAAMARLLRVTALLFRIPRPHGDDRVREDAS
ncbi:MAG: TRAP transporter small permease subunit [Geminicoccaceae bacterium]|jgi:TRAP-type mannitol/chloroaromatic compound transport system permease small subunit|nr:TRAP transporter small permease subunit [Geminicoccaceae bacterium]HRY26590.1 TRAP transporter small permease subunit [Geminicoccaceae bacterium]